MSGQTVLTIGNFDGVHLGHRALVSRARDIAGARGRVVALVFYPHPVTVLAPERATPALTTFESRAALLRAAGADEVVRLEPSPGILGLPAETFIDRVLADYGPAAFVEGPDFHFGKGRAGNIETLRALGRSRGFEVDVLDPVSVSLVDQTVVTASSTMVRWLLSHGRVRDATRVLGRAYELTGTVVQGDRRGRDLGFPTANLKLDCLPPADGVYSAHAALPGGRVFPAAVHVGPRATFDRVERTVEAHIMRWKGPLAENGPEYGWPLTLLFHGWLRGQLKFDSVDELVVQMGRDVTHASEVLLRALPESVTRVEEASV